MIPAIDNTGAEQVLDMHLSMSAFEEARRTPE